MPATLTATLPVPPRAARPSRPAAPSAATVRALINVAQHRVEFWARVAKEEGVDGDYIFAVGKAKSAQAELERRRAQLAAIS